MFKKICALSALILFSLAAYAYCAHCIPVNEPTGDPCSIAGWCGNGNSRAQRVERDPQTGALILSSCSRLTGSVCSVY